MPEQTLKGVAADVCSGDGLALGESHSVFDLDCLGSVLGSPNGVSILDLRFCMECASIEWIDVKH
jgi:hypothetical protein